MSLGVLFAITNRTLKRLLAAEGDEGVKDIIEEIEERWDAKWLCELDKSWDGLHRCLTDGELEFNNGDYPLNHAILGGRQMHKADDYIVALVLPDQVADVSRDLQSIDEQELEKRYWRINRNNYGAAPNQLCEDDLEYIQANFPDLKAFYAKASTAGRSVIFTVDQ
jgi:hypothetical protein